LGADTFRLVAFGTEAIGDYLAENHLGRSLWTLDVNRDGRQDFAVTHQTERFEDVAVNPESRLVQTAGTPMNQ